MLKRITLPRLAINYAVLSGAELFSKFLVAIAFAYLGRILGPEVYGHLEFALAILLISTLFVDFGLNTIGARELAKDSGSHSKLLIHITGLRFIISILMIIIIIIFAQSISQPQYVKNLILLFGLAIGVVPFLIQWVYQGLGMMQFVALASMIRWSVFTAGIFIFVRSYDDIWIIPLIEAFALSCIATFMGAVYLRLFGFPKALNDLSYGLTLLKKAFPIGASEVVWAVEVYFATITLGLLISGPAIGWFTSAHRIVLSLHAFVWLYFYNLLPSIARTTQEPIYNLNKLMNMSMKLSSWAAVFIGIFGTAFSGVIIRLFYGEQFDQATSAFQVLIWLIPLALLSGHYRYTLIGYDLQQKEFISALSGAGVIVVLNIILTPRYGYLGAAWAILISEIVIWLIAWLFVNRLVTPLNIFRYLWQPVLAGVAALILLYLLIPLNIWIAGFAAAISYALLFLYTQPDLKAQLRTLMVRDQVVRP